MRFVVSKVAWLFMLLRYCGKGGLGQSGGVCISYSTYVLVFGRQVSGNTAEKKRMSPQ